MCDYSLHNVKTRPARVGDRLTTRVFNITTRGFSAPEDVSVAVCVLPGTELSFTREVMRVWPQPVIHHETAVFRQINLDRRRNSSRCTRVPRRPNRAADIPARRTAGDSSSDTGNCGWI